ncbi:hypothetical protein LIER_42550 [Lithospermum erythrorhizon]|uniref:Uncharacterized protein n=1 Tax=Lithospermum erythrorhizon TaxID=34254 RepID=A0AAV3NIG0_LITER
MEKFIAFIVLLLLVNQRQKFVEGLLTPIQSVAEPIVKRIAILDGETPPSSCSSDHDCAQEHVSSNCFRPNHSESGLCLSKDINL